MQSLISKTAKSVLKDFCFRETFTTKENASENRYQVNGIKIAFGNLSGSIFKPIWLQNGEGRIVENGFGTVPDLNCHSKGHLNPPGNRFGRISAAFWEPSKTNLRQFSVLGIIRLTTFWMLDKPVLA